MLLIRSIVFLHRNTLLSFKSNPSLHTVSYAADKSIRTVPDFMHFWYPASIKYVKVRTFSQHEMPSRKPACSIGRTFSISGCIILCIILWNSSKLQLKSATGRKWAGVLQSLSGFFSATILESLNCLIAGVRFWWCYNIERLGTVLLLDKGLVRILVGSHPVQVICFFWLTLMLFPTLP